MKKPTLDVIQATIRAHVGVVASPEFVVEQIFEDGAQVVLGHAPGMSRLGDTVSGPVLMTLADAAIYAAIIAHVPDGENAVTSHLNIEFLRRPPLADLRARAFILRAGRRSVTCRAELFSGDDAKPVAHVTAAYARITREHGIEAPTR
ncbi:MAG: PaaI family thioesterase [Salinisphaera sp.]|jgi:uncharacterized protein (TIGR00369 family)|nr:PaaI family thioesterase [Salinisphaera sp.]